MRRYFVLGGALLGLLGGLSAIGSAYQSAPSPPGPFEMIIQGLIVSVLAGAGAVIGFLLGAVVKSSRRAGASESHKRGERGTEDI